jgi:molybdenum cofactor cytidylyltransferase
MVEGLITAAGLSSRTGSRHKLSLQLDGQTVLGRAVLSLKPFCRTIFVVTGHMNQQINDLLRDFNKVETIYNPDYREGMFSSIAAGLRMIKAEYCLYLPGDHPFISHGAIQSMLERKADILVPRYDGKPGHPVLLSKRTIGRILSSQTNSTLRDFILENDPEYVDVDCPGILQDIDTIEDYDRALEDLASI